jgi:hypothetical protein
MNGLSRMIAREIKAGRWLGYRFLTIHHESIGIESNSGREGTGNP